MSRIASIRTPGGLLLAAVLVFVTVACGSNKLKSGKEKDEAMRAGRTPQSMPAADDDYFRDMDGGMGLSREEVMGRNMWIVWTGGNDRFWDAISQTSFGTLDFLKTVSSHPAMTNPKRYDRDNRFEYLGLVNEPCFRKATGPDPARYGLWLDMRDPSCPPDPFANAKKYPGIKVGARGKTVPVGSYYGEPPGIVGLRLFPNPAFDEDARKKWDAERYYRDPDYYDSQRSRQAVPGRHVVRRSATSARIPSSRRPIPRTRGGRTSARTSARSTSGSIASSTGRATTNGEASSSSCSTRRGPASLDTSLVSTDNINNPRTMNAVYLLAAAHGQAKKWGKETLAGGGLDNRQFNDFVPAGDPLAQFFQAPSTVVDAARAQGRLRLGRRARRAQPRVPQHRPVQRGMAPTFHAARRRQADLADRDRRRAEELGVLAGAPRRRRPTWRGSSSSARRRITCRTRPAARVSHRRTPRRSRKAKSCSPRRCARCHSSKMPAAAAGPRPRERCNGKDYLACWNSYWAWTKTDAFKKQMRPIVLADDFLTDNYLSTELRVPSRCCRPTSAARSRPTRSGTTSGTTSPRSPTRSCRRSARSRCATRSPARVGLPLPGGGRGFTRPASLVSAWSTAPFLQNNTVGRFDPSPSVEARMRVFQDSIEQMLWPERRREGSDVRQRQRARRRLIDRTTEDSEIRVPPGYIPDGLRGLTGLAERLFPFLVKNGEVRIGPIRKGRRSISSRTSTWAPTCLTSSGSTQQKKLVKLFQDAADDLKAGRNIFENQNIAKQMLELSKCRTSWSTKATTSARAFSDEPGLSDADKLALIAFVKTF